MELFHLIFFLLSTHPFSLEAINDACVSSCWKGFPIGRPVPWTKRLSDSCSLALGTCWSLSLAASQGSKLVALPTSQLERQPDSTDVRCHAICAGTHGTSLCPTPPTWVPDACPVHSGARTSSIMNSKVDFTTWLAPYKTKCQNKSCHN